MRTLELFSGIGGFAAAGGVPIVAAIDISEPAAQVYQANFRHRYHIREIASLGDDTLARFDADLWWMSPPCQPFTRRGRQADTADPRCAAFLRLLEAISRIRPDHVALENVPGFETSIAFTRMQRVLTDADYQWASAQLCSSQFGYPNHRPRFFLLASRRHSVAIPAPTPPTRQRKIAEFLEPDRLLERFASELEDPRLGGYVRAVDLVDPASETSTCFTAAYGHSLVRSGSYLRTGKGVRRFAPRELASLLGFPATFQLPRALSTRQLWKLLGNSVSIPCVRHVMQSLLQLAAV